MNTVSMLIPPPRILREKRIVIAMSAEEKKKLYDYAKKRGEPPAAVGRMLILAGVEAAS